MMRPNHPILVTGSPRSGTTWVGKMLTATPQAYYIHEPFNNNYPKPVLFEDQFPYWFMYLCLSNGRRYYRQLARLINFRPSFFSILKSVKNRSDMKEALLMFSDMRRLRFEKKRPLIKDPIAVFSSEWLAGAFDMDVVFMIRHPASVVASLTRLNWNANPKALLRQDLLREDHLESFVEEIDRITKDGDRIARAALLWKIIYHVAGRYGEKNPAWLFVKQEDLALDPVEGFKRLYSHVHLDFTDEIAKTIRHHSNESNPAEPDHHWQIIRNSKLNIAKWRDMLQPDEVKTVRDIVEDVSYRYYSDSSWE